MKLFSISIQRNAIVINDSNEKGNCIVLSDKDNKLIIEELKGDDDSLSVHKTCEGILGVYHFSGALYLAVITESEKVGKSASGHSIRRVKSTDFIKVPNYNDDNINSTYVSMVKEVFAVTNIYYSHYDDLTKRLQLSQCSELRKEDHYYPTTMKEEYMFNYPIIGDFAEYKSILLKDMIPIAIFGFVKVFDRIAIGEKELSLMLISRRSIYHNGRRFNTRGVDDYGKVANFVETEQIVKVNQVVSSFVQIRGSIPLRWTQTPTMKYTPKIYVADDKEAFTTHMNGIIKEYGKIIIVNLIDTKKDQLMIGERYENACKEFNDTVGKKLVFSWFDFHKECKGMHYENLSKLVDMTEKEIVEGEFFSYDLKSNRILGIQNNVIRTNCIDCLDRTNVVQSIYAKEMLFTQLFGEKGKQMLKRSYRIRSNCYIDDSNANQWWHVFNNMWSDNADAMSLFYSSSNSLKTDFTRTGKRTTRGALDDGINSIIRYWNNNFQDGYFEDCLNLAFDEVLITERTNRTASLMKKSSFVITMLYKKGSFAYMVILPTSFICATLSTFFFPNDKGTVFCTLFTLSMVGLFYYFVKKGSKYGRLFVSTTSLPKKEKRME